MIAAPPAADAGDSRTGAELYRAACSACHGATVRGAPSSLVGFEVPLPDFTDCSFASRELGWRLPGDPVVGYITRGQGVTAHRTSCPHALSMDPERRIELEWSPEADEFYPVRIHVLCDDRMGLLTVITAAISEGEANILDASVKTRADKRADCYFTISVSGADHLEKVVKSIKNIKHVIKVARLVA